MKISDIFRALADAIDAEQDPGTPDPQLQNPAELTVVDSPYDEISSSEDAACGCEDSAEDLERIKQMAGINASGY